MGDFMKLQILSLEKIGTVGYIFSLGYLFTILESSESQAYYSDFRFKVWEIRCGFSINIRQFYN
jgi:hypothetical protein